MIIVKLPSSFHPSWEGAALISRNMPEYISQPNLQFRVEAMKQSLTLTTTVIMLLCSVQVTFIARLCVLGRRIPPPSPCLGFFKFFLTWFEGLRAEDVTSLQFVKAQ